MEDKETKVKKENKQSKEEQVQETKKNPLQEMTELLQRTQANFENYRKQTELRVAEIQEMAAKDVILQILPVIDNFELALKNVDFRQKNSDCDDFVKGVELIYSQLCEILTDNVVKPIETKNQMFDPYFHEALMKVASDRPENTIIEEFQKGYTIHDKVLRHAKVKVSSGKNDELEKKKIMKINEK